MSRELIEFEFAMIGFLLPVLKLIGHTLDNFSQDTLKNIVLYMAAALLIAFVHKQTETRSSPVHIAGIGFLPWLPSAVFCLFSTIFLMQL